MMDVATEVLEVCVCVLVKIKSISRVAHLVSLGNPSELPTSPTPPYLTLMCNSVTKGSWSQGSREFDSPGVD